MRIIIDRIEGNQAIVELPDMTTTNMPLCIFPHAKEGDAYKITKDENEAIDRQSMIQSKFDKLKR